MLQNQKMQGVTEPWKICLHRTRAEFNTTLKLLGLQINDILFPLSFDLGEIGIFWRYFYCRWPEYQKMGSTLMLIEGLFLLPASIQAQIIVKGVCRNETATIKTVRKKPFRRWCDWRDLEEWSFLKQNVLQRLGKFLNDLLYGDKMKQIGATCLEKIVQWNHNIIFE